MNRKQVLKDMKKKKKETTMETEENYVNRFVTYLFIFLVLLIGSYLFIGIFVTKSITIGKKKEKKETKEVTIDNTTILAGQLFNQNENEYYVLIYDTTDEKSSLKNWKGIYENKENSLKVYVVDTSNKMNSSYIVNENSNKTPSSYSDLKIISPTLIKVSNNAVAEYSEGEEAIKNIFKK